MINAKGMLSCVLAITAVALASPALGAMPTISNSFDADPGWELVVDGGAATSTLGWTATNNAMGAGAGEIGGTFVRNMTFEYYADLDSFSGTTYAPLTEADDIAASGRMFLGNISDDGPQPQSDEAVVGHFNTAEADFRDGMVGLNIKDRDADTMRIRLEVRKGGSQQYTSQQTAYLSENTVVDFEYLYDAGDDTFYGKLTLVSGSFEDSNGNDIGDTMWEDTLALDAGVTDIDVNAFGIGSRTRPTNVGEEYVDVFFDDLTYSARFAGDANGDGAVTDADYTVWADNYGATPATPQMGDFNGDGVVTDADYTIWADNYGAGLGAVPEPATLGALALGGCVLLRRRR